MSNSALFTALFPLVSFLVILVIFVVATGHKLKAFFELLYHGLNKEFTTIPGFISIFVVGLIVLVSVLFAVMQEFHDLFIMAFRAEEHSGYSFPLGLMILFPVITGISNFVFIALMRPK